MPHIRQPPPAETPYPLHWHTVLSLRGPWTSHTTSLPWVFHGGQLTFRYRLAPGLTAAVDVRVIAQWRRVTEQIADGACNLKAILPGSALRLVVVGTGAGSVELRCN